MRLLIVGKGGREHALCWKLSQSPDVTKIFVTKGNAGTSLENKTTNINISSYDIKSLVTWVSDNNIDLTIVGPEKPLALGIKNEFMAAKLNCFGPTKEAARIESSKCFAKKFMVRNSIPTAPYRSFNNEKEALNFIKNHAMPLVIKKDGLAAGKGVAIIKTYKEAITCLNKMFARDNKDEQKVIIEDFIYGQEISFMVMVNGTQVLPLASARDYKRLGSYDIGPNTGGMGAYSPSLLVTADLEKKIMATIVEPTVMGMARENIPFQGFLYFGLILTDKNELFVLEYNCRFGDPETQPILLRLQSDLLIPIMDCMNNNLDNTPALKWDERVALGVVLADKDYPNNYTTNQEIIGNLNSPSLNCKVFHSGTFLRGSNIVTSGGRVLCVTALGETLEVARRQSYALVNHIKWPNMYYRHDIGYQRHNNNIQPTITCKKELADSK